jgi:hypothetical protein
LESGILLTDKRKRGEKMRKSLVLLMASAFLAAMAVTAVAQQGQENQNNGPTNQTFALGQKIMGYDVAPGSDQDGSVAYKSSDPSNVGPTGTGLKIYKGMAFGKFEKAYSWEDLACDFGGYGVWICYRTTPVTWAQISGAYPDAIISGHFKSATYDEIIGDFGSLGLWMWEPGASSDFPGTWTELSGANAVWEFGTDENGDGVQELYVNFGTLGVWRYSSTSGWAMYSALNPTLGLRMDDFAYGIQEGCFCFPGVGVWRLWAGYVQQITGTTTFGNTNASAKFRNGTAEDLVMDFRSLGIWLLTDQSFSDWHQISTDHAYRNAVVKFGTDNPGLVMMCKNKTGLWYWHYSGSFPGTEVMINATSPDVWGFVEPFDYNQGDGDDELAVAMGSSGLWVYEYYGGVWTQLSGQQPRLMVAGDWMGAGTQEYLAVNFGAQGLWLYDGVGKSWVQLSGLSPAYSLTYYYN